MLGWRAQIYINKRAISLELFVASNRPESSAVFFDIRLRVPLWLEGCPQGGVSQKRLSLLLGVMCGVQSKPFTTAPRMKGIKKRCKFSLYEGGDPQGEGGNLVRSNKGTTDTKPPSPAVPVLPPRGELSNQFFPQRLFLLLLFFDWTTMTRRRCCDTFCLNMLCVFLFRIA